MADDAQGPYRRSAARREKEGQGKSRFRLPVLERLVWNVGTIGLEGTPGFGDELEALEKGKLEAHAVYNERDGFGWRFHSCISNVRREWRVLLPSERSCPPHERRRQQPAPRPRLRPARTWRPGLRRVRPAVRGRDDLRPSCEGRGNYEARGEGRDHPPRLLRQEQLRRQALPYQVAPMAPGPLPHRCGFRPTGQADRLRPPLQDAPEAGKQDRPLHGVRVAGTGGGRLPCPYPRRLVVPARAQGDRGRTPQAGFRQVRRGRDRQARVVRETRGKIPSSATNNGQARQRLRLHYDGQLLLSYAYGDTERRTMGKETRLGKMPGVRRGADERFGLRREPRHVHRVRQDVPRTSPRTGHEKEEDKEGEKGEGAAPAFRQAQGQGVSVVFAEEPGYLCWFYDAVDGNEELKQAIAALPEFPARLAKYRERKGLKDKTLEQRIEEVVARMFAVEPTPQETDALCDRLFNGQAAPAARRPRYGRRRRLPRKTLPGGPGCPRIRDHGSDGDQPDKTTGASGQAWLLPELLTAKLEEEISDKKAERQLPELRK